MLYCFSETDYLKNKYIVFFLQHKMFLHKKLIAKW